MLDFIEWFTDQITHLSMKADIVNNTTTQNIAKNKEKLQNWPWTEAVNSLTVIPV